MNSNTIKGSIMAALILFVTCSAQAQQVVTDSHRTDESKISQPSDKTQSSFATNRGIGKTRSEVLAELRQAQEEGTAMPTGFLAYDAPARVPKYETYTQHYVAK